MQRSGWNWEEITTTTTHLSPASINTIISASCFCTSEFKFAKTVCADNPARKKNVTTQQLKVPMDEYYSEILTGRQGANLRRLSAASCAACHTVSRLIIAFKSTETRRSVISLLFRGKPLAVRLQLVY